MSDFLLNGAWTGPLLWAALYVSDYFLTIACARSYQAQDKIVIEGSYEITPLFQADVNALRLVSPRFIVALLASTGYLVLVRSFTEASFSNLYVGVLGAMILIQATVHMRHLRNWFLFKKSIGFIRGRLEYPRGIAIRVSALELLLFSGLYAFLFLATESTFVLGGAIACGVLSMNHYRLARRHDATSLKAA